MEIFQGSGNGLDNTIVGGAGDDTLNGGAGKDTMRGGAGNDTYFVDNLNDVVDENEVGSSGIDRVQSSVAFNLANSTHALGIVENLTLTGNGNINATGNGADNNLTGNGGANVLDGGIGSDTMAGGANNDTYVVDSAGDTVVEGSGGGTDLVRTTLAAYHSEPMSKTWRLRELVISRGPATTLPTRSRAVSVVIHLMAASERTA